MRGIIKDRLTIKRNKILFKSSFLVHTFVVLHIELLFVEQNNLQNILASMIVKISCYLVSSFLKIEKFWFLCSTIIKNILITVNFKGCLRDTAFEV